MWATKLSQPAKVLVLSNFPMECVGEKDRLWKFIKTKKNENDFYAFKFLTYFQ